MELKFAISSSFWHARNCLNLSSNQMLLTVPFLLTGNSQNRYTMSPGSEGVFQLLKEVTFGRILAFYDALKWGHLSIISAWFSAHMWKETSNQHGTFMGVSFSFSSSLF
jgi:hypothetical protein